MIFRCRVCSEKSARISDLQAQISYLKSLLSPNTDVSASQLEADAVLSGRQDVIELHREEPPAPAEEFDIESERDRLVAGTY
jgi:hypothetical protein